MIKPSNLTLFFLVSKSAQLWPTTAFGHISESQLINLFTEEMDTHLKPPAVEIEQFDQEAQQHDCLFLVFNRGPAIWPTFSLVCRAFGPKPFSESQPIWLCSVRHWYSCVCYQLIRSNCFVMLIQLWHHPYLEVQPFLTYPSKVQKWSNDLTNHIEEPLALPYFTESQTIWLFTL